MSLVRQLPAYSPITLRAVLTAGRALLGGSAASRRTLEELLLTEFQPRRLALLDSGTSALAVAIRLSGPAGGVPVVALPAYGCYDLATAADMAGAQVVLYDLDPATLGPDAVSLEAALAQGVSALVVAHLFGIPVDLEALRPLASAAGAVLIEDAAQAVGARYRGRLLGTLADAGVLSFGRGKGRTGGHGGALIAYQQGIADRLATEPVPGQGGGVGEYVMLKAQWLLGRPAVYGLLASVPQLGLGQTVYRAPHPVRGLSPVAAGALVSTWPLEPEETAQRRQTANRLLERLADHPRFRVPRAPEASEPGYLRLPVVAEGPSDPPFETAAALRLGIMPGYPSALCDLERFRHRIINAGGTFPGARLLAARLGTLPTHSRLRERHVVALTSWLDRLR